MENKKLIVREKRYKGDTMVVSIRLPSELVSDVDKIVEKTGRTRNEIMQLCLEFAMENLEIETNKKQGE